MSIYMWFWNPIRVWEAFLNNIENDGWAKLYIHFSAYQKFDRVPTPSWAPKKVINTLLPNNHFSEFSISPFASANDIFLEKIIDYIVVLWTEKFLLDIVVSDSIVLEFETKLDFLKPLYDSIP